jgi:5-methyltetrahydrofolate--homocysteine methyltransferase
MEPASAPVSLAGLTQSVIDGDQKLAIQLTQQLLDSGMEPLEIFRKSLFPAMDIVGQRMKLGEYFIPEVLLSSRAMRAASDLIKPRLIGANAPKPSGRIVFGTVKDDLHDIGKNLVIMLLEGAGFQVIDLGVNVHPDKFVASVRNEKPDILCLSALLSITMINMKDVLKALEDAGLRQSVKVMIGGAVISRQFADEIKADGFASDAASAPEEAKKLLRAS